MESKYRKISKLDKKIRRAQKSTGTLFNLAIPLHDKLRQRFNWYYRWHMLPVAPLVHWLVLYCYIFGFVVAFYSAFLFSSTNQPVLASTGGPNEPGSVVSDSSGGSVAWSNPGNAQTADDAWATASTPGIAALSQYLKATNFGFSIPSNAVIDGVTVKIERHSGAYAGLGVKDNTVKLVKSGSISGDNQADTDTAWPTTDGIKTYGSESDLWNVALTPADVNAADFGVVLSANHYNPGPLTSYIDHITITINYTTNFPTVNFSSTSSSGSESAAAVNLTVSLSASSASDVSVEFSAGGTATAGSDYALTTTTPLTIPAGSTTGNIALSVTDDSADESDETVIITLSNPTNATLGTNSVHTYSIINNDESTVATTTSYTITASVGSNGSISPSGNVDVSSGTSRTFTITPNTGYRVNTLIIDSVSVNPANSYTFSNVTANHSISATFIANKSAATTTSDPSSDDDDQTVAGASSDGAKPDPKSNVKYIIDASAGEGGTIEPGGAVSVGVGNNQSFIITADTGYRIKTVRVDGVDLTGLVYDRIYTHNFEAVGRDHSISAQFELAPTALTNVAANAVAAEATASPLGKISAPILRGLQALGVSSEEATPVLSTTVAAVTVASVGLAAAANAVTLFSLPELFHSLWYSIIALGMLGRRQRWGRVIERGTGISLPGVRIVLTSATDGKQIGTTLTGSDGSFAFAAPPGRYKLQATKDLYEVVAGDKNSFKPESIIEIKDYSQGLIVPTIVMATQERNLQSRRELIGHLNRLEKIATYFSVIVLLFGTVVAVSEVISQLNLRNIIFSLIYLIFWVMNARVVMKRSPWGNVVDKADTKPIPLALVRIIDKNNNRLIKTAVTNEAGKFSVFISRGVYGVAVAKPGYKMRESVPFVALERLRAMNRDIALERV